MRDYIRENYGGFAVVNMPVPQPTITKVGKLKYEITKNISVRANPLEYAVLIYINGTFIFQTTDTVVDLTTIPGILELYEHKENIELTFIQKKIIGQIKESAPVTFIERLTVASNDLLCSETTICRETVVED